MTDRESGPSVRVAPMNGATRGRGDFDDEFQHDVDRPKPMVRKLALKTFLARRPWH
jgi:hypothetical protein